MKTITFTALAAFAALAATTATPALADRGAPQAILADGGDFLGVPDKATAHLADGGDYINPQDAGGGTRAVA